jgi:hypothetical protein
MGKVRSLLDDAAIRFIEAQHIFFVASAPLDPSGHVNLSPGDSTAFAFSAPPPSPTSISTAAESSPSPT